MSAVRQPYGNFSATITTHGDRLQVKLEVNATFPAGRSQAELIAVAANRAAAACVADLVATGGPITQPEEAPHAV